MKVRTQECNKELVKEMKPRLIFREEIGREDINKYGMYIKFTCRIDDSI